MQMMVCFQKSLAPPAVGPAGTSITSGPVRPRSANAM